MIDCKTVLQELDLSHFQLEEVAEPLREHFETCEHCQHVAGQRQRFDEQLTAALHRVPVPAGLQARLLATIEHELGVQSQTPELPATANATNPAKRSWRRRLWTALTLTAACLVVGGVVWFASPGQPATFDVADATVQQELRSFREAVSEETAALLDDDALLSGLDPRLSRLKTGHLFGVDLNSDQNQDAAGFRFQSASASGVILVLPSSSFTGTTTSVVPESQSGRIYQWRSTDGTLTYVCYIERGNPRPLFESLFELA